MCESASFLLFREVHVCDWQIFYHVFRESCIQIQ